MSFWGTLGSVAANYVVDWFRGDDDQVIAGSSGQGTLRGSSGSDTLGVAYQQQRLAQSRTDTGIREGRHPPAMKAQNEMANFVKDNINPDVVRKNIIAQLIRQGAEPQLVKNIMAQWDTQDKALATPRKTLPQEGFAQKIDVPKLLADHT